jgi:hypothetical protein
MAARVRRGTFVFSGADLRADNRAHDDGVERTLTVDQLSHTGHGGVRRALLEITETALASDSILYQNVVSRGTGG